MLKKGLDISLISEVTGLSNEQINKLKQILKHILSILFMKNLSNCGESIRNKIKSIIKDIKLGDNEKIIND